jgi:hypothetical protein
VAAAPGVEICDGIDNDCDGETDEDDVCGSSFCDLDFNEPNDSVATATLLGAGSMTVGISCDADVDYFALDVTPNRAYRLNLPYYDTLGDVDVEVLANGTTPVGTGATFGSGLRVSFTAQAGSTYVARVSNVSATDTYYQISLVEELSSCQNEDIFAPNQSRSTASLLLPEWYIDGGVCANTSDWYNLGSLEVGDGVDVYLDMAAPIVGDLDLYLWNDPDGDGNFTIAGSSLRPEGVDEDLYHVVSVAGPYYIQVTGYLGDPGPYLLEYYLD